ncbi:MAG: hypothetical protein DCF22_21755 [Leptolyngbya sp.]|nr:MAG: hypothetical protein DCF22_21755 [Leptolyngbya sp.]
MRLNRIFRFYTPQIIGTMAVLGLCVIAAPRTLKNMDQMSMLSGVMQEQAAQRDMLEAAKEDMKARAEIADERLREGCSTFLVAENDPGKFGNVHAGGKVINPVTGLSLPEYSKICDNQGGTAILANNGSEIVMVDIAVTQNFDLVRKAMAVHGINPLAGDGRVGGANARLDQKGDKK